MKINKPKSPYIGGADAPDAKDIAKAVKGGKFADALSAITSDNPAEASAASAMRETLAQIALQADLTNDQSLAQALQDSAEVLVKSRLSGKFKESKQSEKIVKDLSQFVSDDPFFKSKLLSVLQKLRDGAAH